VESGLNPKDRREDKALARGLKAGKRRAWDRSDAADREMRGLCAVMGRSGAKSFVDALAEEALGGDPKHFRQYVRALAESGTAKALEVLKLLKEKGRRIDGHLPRLEGRVRARQLMTDMKEERTK